MYKQLIIMLLAIGGYNQKQAADKLGYKTLQAMQRAIINKDIKLAVINNVCKLCGLDIVVTDHKAININITEYIQQHATDNDSSSSDNNNSNQ